MRRALVFLVALPLAAGCSGSTATSSPIGSGGGATPGRTPPVTGPGTGGDPPITGQGTGDPAVPVDEDWPQFRHDVRGSSAAGTSLTTAQGATLHEVWSFELGQYDYSEPIRAGDAVYATTGVTGKVIALDAATGALRWTRDLGFVTTSGCGGLDKPGIWGSAAFFGGTLYVAAPDGAVHAMDPASGADRWTAHVADPAPHAELIVSSPSVSIAGGRLYVGVAATAHCDPVPGRVAGIELASGTVVSETAMVDAGKVGGAVWTSMSVDEAGGVLFTATGNQIGGLPGEPLAQSIVALDPATLAPLAHWQNPVTLDNCDFGSSPTLFADAAGRKLVAAANKDGWLYALDRASLAAGPVWKRQLAVVDPALPAQCGDPLLGFGSIVSPAFANGTLYAAGGRTPAGAPGAVVALDPATGTLRFTHVTPGFVLGAMAVAGDVLAVVSNAVDSTSSTLEILDARTGDVLRSFARPTATFGGVSVSRGGLVLWGDFEGHLTAFAP
jgi:outer membrane protein assembly factor BamB